jgi:hypothetical protein
MSMKVVAPFDLMTLMRATLRGQRPHQSTQTSISSLENVKMFPRNKKIG